MEGAYSGDYSLLGDLGNLLGSDGSSSTNTILPTEQEAGQSWYESIFNKIGTTVGTVVTEGLPKYLDSVIYGGNTSNDTERYITATNVPNVSGEPVVVSGSGISVSKNMLLLGAIGTIAWLIFKDK